MNKNKLKVVFDDIEYSMGTPDDMWRGAKDNVEKEGEYLSLVYDELNKMDLDYVDPSKILLVGRLDFKGRIKHTLFYEWIISRGIVVHFPDCEGDPNLFYIIEDFCNKNILSIFLSRVFVYRGEFCSSSRDGGYYVARLLKNGLSEKQSENMKNKILGMRHIDDLDSWSRRCGGLFYDRLGKAYRNMGGRGEPYWYNTTCSTEGWCPEIVVV